MGNSDASEEKSIDFRQHPEQYRIRRGEQGVLSSEPYTSELVKFWRFRTPDIARESAATLYSKYIEFRTEDNFVGMDMSRKFIQMGWTRARRYANHRTGRKYDPATGEKLPSDEDPEKAESAAIFKAYFDRIRTDPLYVARRSAWRKEHGDRT